MGNNGDLKGLATRESAMPQPAPRTGEGDYWAKVLVKWDGYADNPAKERVLAWMRERDRFGREKYGTALQKANGREALLDMLQELLDARVYAEQCADLDVSPRLSQILTRLTRDLDGVLYALADALPGDISEGGNDAIL